MTNFNQKDRTLMEPSLLVTNIWKQSMDSLCTDVRKWTIFSKGREHFKGKKVRINARRYSRKLVIRKRRIKIK